MLNIDCVIIKPTNDHTKENFVVVDLHGAFSLNSIGYSIVNLMINIYHSDLICFFFLLGKVHNVLHKICFA